ncbi:hypothetical protein OH77DRAFT_936854 [Trametes cingulata]|nr:hypothetical protein OH77DRAFT_936854 [Trametes cingulata]
MQQSRPRLPIEVIEHVIDAVGFSSLASADILRVSSRYNALRSCSLLCTQLLPRSRFHLFRNVVLRSVDDYLRLSRLHAVVTTSRQLGALVEVVVIIAGTTEQSGKPKPLPRNRVEALRLENSIQAPQERRGAGHIFSATGPKSQLVDAFLARLVENLPRLHTVKTHVLPISFGNHDRDPFPWCLRMSLLSAHTISALHLEAVVFRFFTDLLQFLFSMPSLRLLDCSHVSWLEYAPFGLRPIKGPIYASLDELRLDMRPQMAELVRALLFARSCAADAPYHSSPP